jgi:hypothetical protein
VQAPNWTRHLLIVLFFALPRLSSAAVFPIVEWFHQFGTTENDFASGIAVAPSGDVYVAGRTNGPLDGSPQTYFAAFLRKFTSDGQTSWTRQVRTSKPDFFASANAVATDSLGRIWIAGVTTGNFLGPQNLDSRDGLVVCFDASGTQLLIDQIAGYGAGDDEVWSIAGDGTGNTFVVGIIAGDSRTSLNAGDAFATRYDALGSPDNFAYIVTDKTDRAWAVAVDGQGDVYVGGTTSGRLTDQNRGPTDGFIRKFGANKNVIWTTQIGTSDLDGVSDLAVDTFGNLLMLGWSNTSLDGPTLGSRDLFLRKYDPSGQILWKKQFGTSGFEEAHGLSLDALGNIYVGGATTGSFGVPNAGNYDPFVQKYDSSGKLIWTYQFGTPAYDQLTGIGVTATGEVYATGYSTSSFNGQPVVGGADSFIAKIVEVPEPAMGGLVATGILCTIMVLRGGRSKRRSYYG